MNGHLIESEIVVDEETSALIDNKLSARRLPPAACRLPPAVSAACIAPQSFSPESRHGKVQPQEPPVPPDPL
jgi:hypothetical protein